MSKQEIVQRLKDNYINRLSVHIKGMEKQGYILAEDEVMHAIYLMRFNANRFKFEVVASLGEVYKHIDFENVANPFKIVLNKYYINDLVEHTLKTVNADDLYKFEQYEENVENVTAQSEMQADLKSYLNLSKKLAGNISKGMQDTPQSQAQILAGKNVFYTGRENSLKISECNKYYLWNKKADRFQQLSAEQIRHIITDITGVEHTNLEIETNMRTVYPVMVTNTPFPVLWNKQKDLQDKLKRQKKGHDKIAKIVANYE